MRRANSAHVRPRPLDGFRVVDVEGMAYGPGELRPVAEVLRLVAYEESFQKRPFTRPVSTSTSILRYAGDAEVPGISLISPATGTTSPAPR